VAKGEFPFTGLLFKSANVNGLVNLWVGADAWVERFHHGFGEPFHYVPDVVLVGFIDLWVGKLDVGTSFGVVM
jgi:hypothetical protein